MRALVLLSALALVGCAHQQVRDDRPLDGAGGGVGLDAPAVATRVMLAGGMGVGGLKSISGGPNEHASQNMTATSITLSAASGATAISLVRGAALNFGTKDLSENVNNEIATSGVLRAQSFSSTISSGFNALAVINNGGRIDYGAGASDYASSDGTTVTFAGPVKSAASQTRGTITLAAGTGTATVITGAVCTCTDTTAANVVKCAVSSTTLTATGTGTDVVAYLCF